MTNKIEKYIRSDIYENEEPQPPKYTFLTVLNELREKLEKDGASLLDIGGASGDFIYYVGQEFPNAVISMVDHDPALTKIAQNKNQNANIIEKNILDLDDVGLFDCASMIGVHSCFDNFEELFKATFTVVKPGGMMTILGLFNDYPIDALIYHKESKDDAYQSGFNLFSVETVSNILDKQEDVLEYSFSDFMPPIEIEKTDDATRSWSETRDDGSRFLVNGFMQVPLKNLTIKKK